MLASITNLFLQARKLMKENEERSAKEGQEKRRQEEVGVGD